MNNKAIIAIIDAILSSRLEEIKTIKGPRGLRGRPGKDFQLDEHLEPVSKILQTIVDDGDFKLKYSDLTDEDKEELKLKFEDLSVNELEQLMGPRGPRGRDGKSFNFYECKEDIEQSLKSELPNLKLKFSDLTKEDKEELTLKFGHLTDEEKSSLKGEKGFRGQRGKVGESGAKGEQGPKGADGKDGIQGEKGLDGKDGEQGPKGFRGQRGKIGEKGEQGPMGIQGIPGIPGVAGRTGRDGEDGQDAPFITDIQVEQLSSNEIGFVFEFSDGSVIETGSIELPSITQLAYSMMASTGGGGGGSISVSDGTTTVDPATGIEFTGATVVDNGGVAEVTIDGPSITDGVTTLVSNDICFDGATVTDNGGQTKVTIDGQDCIVVADEGNEITDCLKSINFVGSNVQAYNSTVIADWPSLDVIDFIGSWESGSPGQVTVEVFATATTLQETYTAGEPVTAFNVMRLTNGQTVFNAKNDGTFIEAQSVGISLTTGIIGTPTSVVMFGILSDPGFTFGANVPLFVGAGGVITDVAPLVGYIIQIGHGLGTGAIFVKVEEPILIL